MSQNVLLISDVMLKERTSIHGNIDPKLIMPHLKYAQDIYITPILGSALDAKLKSIIKDGTIDTDVNLKPYKTLIDDYLVDALIWYALSELPETISFQFWNKGVVRRAGDDTQLPSMTELVAIANKYKMRADDYANRMRLFIIENVSKNNWYPEYLNPGTGIDTIAPHQNQFTMPMWLGKDDDGDPPLRHCRPWQPYKD